MFVAFALPDNLPQLWVPPDGPGWIIPTAIDYDGNGQTFWGNAAAERPNPRIWFKLFIKGSPAVDLQGHNLVGATGGTVGHDNADRLIGDFLSVLQQQLRVHLQGYGPARIEWCFTEPGCWSDEGRLDFRNIVQDRVFNGHARDVSYVSEAEAAAEYTTAEGVYRGLIQQGDVVMVGDCGGATTDLAILQVTGTNPFASQPIGKPDSFRLGAVDIDAALMEQVRRRYWPNDRGLRRGAPAARVRREVSRIKEDFTGLPEDDVPQFELQTPNGEVVEHQFTDADLRRAFNPTVTQIVEAIIQKILLAEARVTKVVLVGGLGSSEYLRSRVRLALDGLDRAFQLVDVLPDT
ncbi:hypothetical protein AbraIFM66951_009322 [Aspergillus brasiliensis]|uniref:Uncharacterized protein n=1 Tax=Aspergillus brasiliensis TaxID=319629 RepID=A0A9W5YS70_9EURO|nr:hypothetical protein AbraCBS73388_009116 [Aspergillus brasiliensis]GKZ46389.1 hypothetical protein AbraIFM66951_009322 [Aspergillus brasiliensis]